MKFSMKRVYQQNIPYQSSSPFGRIPTAYDKLIQLYPLIAQRHSASNNDMTKEYISISEVSHQIRVFFGCNERFFSRLFDIFFV
jgi:hypothetical protein